MDEDDWLREEVIMTHSGDKFYHLIPAETDLRDDKTES